MSRTQTIGQNYQVKYRKLATFKQAEIHITKYWAKTRFNEDLHISISME
jgi:hypothetical protein